MMKYVLVAAIVLSASSVTAEAADEMCVQGFRGCVDGSIIMYGDCQMMGDCTVTLEEAKEDCMKKYPACADRAWLEQRFTEGLAE